MGSLGSFLGDNAKLITQGISLATGIVGDELSYLDQDRQQDRAVENLRARQAEELRQAQEQAAQERQRVTLESQQEEEKRRAALKRAVARQRADFGSQGVGAGTGSPQAVLLGLFNESEDELRRREELDRLRFNALDLGLDQRSRLNVLQLAQLQQRDNLNRIAGRVDSFGRVANYGVNLFNEN